MNLDDVCKTIADALSTIDGLTGYPYDPPTEEAPFGYVSEVAGAAATQGGQFNLNVEVTVCLSLADSYQGRNQAQTILTEVLDTLDAIDEFSCTTVQFANVGADIAVKNALYKGFTVTCLVLV